MNWLLVGLAVSVAALLIAAVLLARFIKRWRHERSDEKAGVQPDRKKPDNRDGDKA